MFASLHGKCFAGDSKTITKCRLSENIGLATAVRHFHFGAFLLSVFVPSQKCLLELQEAKEDTKRQKLLKMKILKF